MWTTFDDSEQQMSIVATALLSILVVIGLVNGHKYPNILLLQMQVNKSLQYVPVFTINQTTGAGAIYKKQDEHKLMGQQRLTNGYMFPAFLIHGLTW